MTVAYIGLGANLGDARQAIKDAIVCLAQQIGVTVIGKSDLYRTAPIESSGDDYLNCAIAVETTLTARQLLTLCLKIELHFGRERPYKNAPRTLDLDLLLYGNERIAEPDLIVPHPRLALRAFVLRPLADLAPELEIPGVGRVSALLDDVADQRIERVAQCCCPTKRAYAS
jgi:2-amino-4-hydroxy-6-hydroxymethyldihydropteridine diphosphokinase